MGGEERLGAVRLFFAVLGLEVRECRAEGSEFTSSCACRAWWIQIEPGSPVGSLAALPLTAYLTQRATAEKPQCNCVRGRGVCGFEGVIEEDSCHDYASSKAYMIIEFISAKMFQVCVSLSMGACWMSVTEFLKGGISVDAPVLFTCSRYLIHSFAFTGVILIDN